MLNDILSFPAERAFFVYAALLNSFIAAIIVVVILVKGRKTEREFSYIVYCSSIVWWNFFFGLWMTADQAQHANLFARLNLLIAPQTAVGFLHFSLVLTGEIERYRKYVYFAYALTGAFGLLAFTPLLVGELSPIMMFPHWPKPGPLFPLQMTFGTLNVVLFFWVLIRGLGNSTGIRREQIRYSLIASIICVPGAMSPYLPSIGLNIKPWGIAIIFVQMAVGAYSILRYRLIDLNLATRNVLIYALFGSIFAGPFILLVRFARFPGSTIAVLVLAIVLAPLFFQKVRDALEHAVDRLPAFKERYDRFRAMREVVTKLEHVQTIENWANCVAKTVEDVFMTKTANVLLWDESQKGYLYKAGFGHSPAERAFMLMPEDGPVVVYSKTHRDILMADMAEHYKTEGIAQEMEFLHAAVSVPMFFDGELKAFLNVGQLPGGRMYNDLDLAHLETLAGAAERSLRVVLSGLRKEQTTALWAHDLVKPFGPKGALGRIEDVVSGKLGSLPADAAEALRLAVSDISFLRCNLQQILRPDGGPSRPVQAILLTAVFDRIKRRFLPIAEEKDIAWHVEVSGEGKVLCGAESLEHRILGNLLENAFRHTPAGGNIKVSASWDHKVCIIVVADNGPGIAVEDQERIFQAGIQGQDGGQAGLGLFIARQVTEQQGGSLTVESQVGKGSVFKVQLKRADV